MRYPTRVLLALILAGCIAACSGHCLADRPSPDSRRLASEAQPALKDFNVHALDFSVFQSANETDSLIGSKERWGRPSASLRQSILALEKSAEDAIRSGDSRRYLDLFDPDSAEVRRQEKVMLVRLFNPRRPIEQEMEMRDLLQIHPDWAVGIVDIRTRPRGTEESTPSPIRVERNWIIDFRTVHGQWKVSDPPYRVFAGQVLDGEKPGPLSGAFVTAADASTRTTPHGLFSFSRLPSGVAGVEVQPSDGRPPQFFDIPVQEGRNHLVLIYKREAQ